MHIRARSAFDWRVAGPIVAVMLVCAVLPTVPAAAATTVTAGGTYSYTEQGGAIGIGEGITITDGTSYDGEYVEFEVVDATPHDMLGLATAGEASTEADAVSIVGDSVYLGNGTIAEPVGSVDETFDGQAGRKLRVNFTSEFVNPGFETGGTLGWTPIEQRIDLGSTSIAGFVVNDTATYPDSAPNRDDNGPASASYTVGATTTGDPTEGTYALQLQSNMTTAQTCDVVHGPAVYSSEFEAAGGDKIYFDWRAFAGSDAYHVFGYIVDRAGDQVEVLDAYTPTAGNSEWATKETVIPAGGHYRFVFVAGTFDATCGKAAGASLLIDNVKVFGSKASDDVAQQIARELQFANTSDDPALQRVVTVTAKSNENGIGSDTVTVDVTPVDDPLDATDPADVIFTNHDTAGEAFAPVSGQVAVSDVDTTTFNFRLVGSEAVSATVAGEPYDQAITTDYGTMYLNGSTGRYAFDPDSPAIDTRLVDDREQFTILVWAGEHSDEIAMDVVIDIPEGVAGAPTNLSAIPGEGTVELIWTAPTWIGGTGVNGYGIEVSSDGGGTWTTATADTDSADTAHVVTGLDNGTTYDFRVVALNPHGTSAPSVTASATPFTVPDAPAITGMTEHDAALQITFSAPGSDGGSPITAYKISVDGGTTWVSVEADELSATVDSLANGTTYQVIVAAENAAGIGEASTPVPATPRTTPDAPSVSHVIERDGGLRVGFAAPGFDGGAAITGYELSIDGGINFGYSFGPDVEQATIEGLLNGTTYQIVVRALNEAGTGAPSAAAAATPRTVPGVPHVTRVVEDDAALHITFAAPASNGGAAISRYELSIDGGKTWLNAGTAAGSVTVDSLGNGTSYDVVVRARNEAGAGAATAPIAATPRTVPGAPAVTSVVEDDGALHVTFTAPVSDGGARIVGYEASVDGGATWQAVAGPGTVTLDGLTNGAVYQVSVRATNEAGGGVAAAISATPRRAPDAPTITRVVGGNRSLVVYVTAPAFDGGADISGYEVSVDNGATWSRSYGTATAPIRLFGLANDTTYPIRVRAVNEAGAGEPSTPVPGMPTTSPITPLDDNEGNTDDGEASATPDVPAGEALALVNGEEVTVDVVATPGSETVKLIGDGWSATIGGLSADGVSMEVDAQGRLIVVEGGSVRVSGTGFAPNTTVDVWLFSTPVFLGEVNVRADGSFADVMPLPAGIAPGEHTVQLNGLGNDGNVRSASVGLILEPAETKRSAGLQMPVTGTEATALVMWALPLLAGGALLVLVSRRRNEEDSASEV